MKIISSINRKKVKEERTDNPKLNIYETATAVALSQPHLETEEFAFSVHAYRREKGIWEGVSAQTLKGTKWYK